MGIDPYPAKTKRTHTATASLKSKGKEVAVAGRVMSIRGHGAIQFFDLVDQSGKIQLVFKKDLLSAISYKLLALLDIGDFLSASGEVFQTQAGEISILVKDFQILSKSVRPLPSKWFGLKDVEERYRKRYLDLIMNPAGRKVFEGRSAVIQAHREFLLRRGYIEVETPVLQPLYGGGLARPFKTYHNALGIPLYLRISTELYLKRLIVAGFEKVFEIAKVFRNEGTDRQHNPEFTLLETMEAYINYEENMKLIEEMTEYTVKKVTGGTKVKFQGKIIDFEIPWKRITMVEAVKNTTGVDFSKITDLKKAVRIAQKLGVSLDAYTASAIGLVLAAVFEAKAEKGLVQPTFVYRFPVETSPLAKKCADDPRYVERVEHYIAGMECSNNYSELNDSLELAERFRDERKKERLGDEEAHQTDNDFIEAIEYGMPPTSGIGPALDRLVMILTDMPSIRDVILFPTLRPQGAPKDNGVRGDKESKFVEKLSIPKTTDQIFFIDESVRRHFSGMKVGVAVIEGVEIRKGSKELEKLKQEVLNRLKGIGMKDIDSFPTVKAYREIFKAFGVDWHNRHPSVDALLRRVAQGKGIYNVNTLVDSYNLAVLESKIGLGAFDYDRLSFPTVLRLSAEDEEVFLLGDSKPTRTKSGEMVYADQSRILTLDLNYRDCDFAKITPETKKIILYADGCPGITSAEVMAGLEMGLEYITRFCGGEVVTKFIVE